MGLRLGRPVQKAIELAVFAGLNPRQTWLLPMRWNDLQPILHDYDSEAGLARGPCFHQDLWAARITRTALSSSPGRNG